MLNAIVRKSAFLIRVPLHCRIKAKTCMNTENITFNDMPQAMAWIVNKLTEIEKKFDGLQVVGNEPTSEWLNLAELCEYLPNHPAEQTVYGWTSKRLIPFHKNGKSVLLLKSEIDDWLHKGKRKSDGELAADAASFIMSKKKARF